MDIRNIIHPRPFRIIFLGMGAVIIALLVFQAGVFMGYRKASFAYRFGDNYYRTFGGHRGMMSPGFFRDNFTAAHGAAGKVISVNLPTFVVVGQENLEKVVLVKDDTLIRRFDERVKPEDIKVDDVVVVLGAPNENSQIEAKLIRILPFPPESSAGTDRY